MTVPRDVDSWLPAWMAEVVGQPARDDQMERLASRIRQHGPRPAWRARIHDRWAHGAGPLARQGGRVGLLAIAVVSLLTLVAFATQLAPGGPPELNVVGPAAPSPGMATASDLPTATHASPSTKATAPPAEVGQVCRPSAPSVLPRGSLPVTSRPPDLPSNDGYLAITGPEFLDPTTGASVGAVAVTSEGTRLPVDTMPLQWSPDGRWLALRSGFGTACGGELIVSSDRTRAVDVTDYPPGRSATDASWSPDGRWLAVVAGDRVDVFGIAADGVVSAARTVWQARIGSGAGSGVGFGPVWGPDGTLAFQVQQNTGTSVAFLRPGASAPELIDVPAGPLAPLAWTADGASIVAIGNVGTADVGMFRITPGGSARIPLDGLHLHGGKWLDVPVAIVGERIVFDAYTDLRTPDSETIFSVRPDGSDLTRLDYSVAPGVTFAPAPDGRHVAVSSNGIWVIDLADGSRRKLTTWDGGIMDWQPAP